MQPVISLDRAATESTSPIFQRAHGRLPSLAVSVGVELVVHGQFFARFAGSPTWLQPKWLRTLVVVIMVLVSGSKGGGIDSRT